MKISSDPCHRCGFLQGCVCGRRLSVIRRLDRVIAALDKNIPRKSKGLSTPEAAAVLGVLMLVALGGVHVGAKIHSAAEDARTTVHAHESYKLSLVDR